MNGKEIIFEDINGLKLSKSHKRHQIKCKSTRTQVTVNKKKITFNIS